MKSAFYSLCLGLWFGATAAFGQHMEMSATVSGSNILVKLKAVDGSVTVGWTDIEFFLRNPITSPMPNFAAAIISVNTTDFPGVSIPYNGVNVQGTEVGYNNYWFGTSFAVTATKTYTLNQEYLLCTIALAAAPTGTNLELCHNEPNFSPHYITLTDGGSNDISNISGGNKFYGAGAMICTPNCPATTSGNNHIFLLNATLPVELLDFHATKTDEHTAVLHWQTAVEQDFRNFQIERSTDGVNWKNIGSTPATGNHSRYTHSDANPPQTLVYYRLQMIDLAGKNEYSTVRSLVFGPGSNLMLYPNPSAGLVYLVWAGDEPENSHELELFDAHGRRMLAQTIVNNRTSIDLSRFAAGAYALRITTGQQVISRRLVRME